MKKVLVLFVFPLMAAASACADDTAFRGEAQFQPFKPVGYFPHGG